MSVKNVRALRRKVLDRVKEHMGWDEDRAMLWLTTPNPLLGKFAPSTMIVMGRGEKLLKFVKECLEENKPPPKE